MTCGTHHLSTRRCNPVPSLVFFPLVWSNLYFCLPLLPPAGSLYAACYLKLIRRPPPPPFLPTLAILLSLIEHYQIRCLGEEQEAMPKGAVHCTQVPFNVCRGVELQFLCWIGCISAVTAPGTATILLQFIMCCYS